MHLQLLSSKLPVEKSCQPSSDGNASIPTHTLPPNSPFNHVMHEYHTRIQQIKTLSAILERHLSILQQMSSIIAGAMDIECEHSTSDDINSPDGFHRSVHFEADHFFDESIEKEVRDIKERLRQLRFQQLNLCKEAGAHMMASDDEYNPN